MLIKRYNYFAEYIFFKHMAILLDILVLYSNSHNNGHMK